MNAARQAERWSNKQFGSGEPSGHHRTAQLNVSGSGPVNFGEAVKLRGSSLPLIERFVTPPNYHQDNR